MLCLGVLYHLRNPLLGLDRISEVSERDMLQETQIRSGRRRRVGGVAAEQEPLMEFHPEDSLNSDPTNWWSPNPRALRAMLESACFEVIDMQVLSTRAIAHTSRVEDEYRHYWRTLDGASTVDFDQEA